MAIVNVSGTVRGLEGVGDALILVELLVPCMGGHKVAAVTLAGPGGQYRFDGVDSETYGETMEKNPAIFVRATVATTDGPKATVGPGSFIEQLVSGDGAAEISFRVPTATDRVAAVRIHGSVPRESATGAQSRRATTAEGDLGQRVKAAVYFAASRAQ